MRLDAVRQALDAELAAVRARLGGASPRVLDVGGGSGTLAVPLAVAGCSVTVIDASANALATLHRRAAEAGVSSLITAVQGDSDVLGELVPAGAADLVLAHGLLEVVEDPKNTVAAMVETVAPGGVVSVVVANRYAAVLHRVIAGKLEEAARLLDDPTGQLPGEALLRRYDVAGLERLLVDGGLTVELVQGSGIFSELVAGDTGELGELEFRAARVGALREVAGRLHAMGRR